MSASRRELKSDEFVLRGFTVKWLCLTLVAVAAVYVVSNRGPSLVEGALAPEIFAAKWINTEADVTLQALRGKVVVVEFWATWCGACVASIPHLNKLNEKWKDRDVAIIALTDEPPDLITEFVRTRGIRYAVGAGSRADLQYGIPWMPYTFVLNGEGRIVWSGHPEDGLDEIIRLAQAKL